MTQAVFQTGEREMVICEHYDVLRDEYPRINVSRRMTVVIGRGNPETDAERIAFYAGWPAAMTAGRIARTVFD